MVSLRRTPRPGPGSPWLRRLAVATLAANVLIVVTGGLVRLTGSGLGCPDWPNCAPGSLLPTRELDWHSYVEFGNRMLTDVVVAVSAALLVAAFLARPARRSVRRGALAVFLGVPAQAILGGITVYTGLNPWVVSVHLVVSMVIIAATTWLIRRIGEGDGARRGVVHPLLARLATAAWLLGFGVVYLGTIVTGSGPHAGAPDVRRIGIDPRTVTQLHADAVMLLVGLSVALAVAVRATGAPVPVRRATAALVAVEAGQAAIGYAQYFMHLPVALVDLHLLGASLLVVALTAVPLSMRSRDGVDGAAVVLPVQPVAAVGTSRPA